MMWKNLIFKRSISTCIYRNTKIMDLNVSVKSFLGKSRFIAVMEEKERRKIQARKKKWEAGIREKKQKEIDYNKPHKVVMHDQSNGSKAYNSSVELSLKLMVQSNDLANILGTSQEFVNNLKIVKARVHPSYKMIYIYWVSRDTTTEYDMAKILGENSNAIRAFLNDSKTVEGAFPSIKFIKDIDHMKMIKMEEYFNEMDKYYKNDQVVADMLEQSAMFQECETLDNESFEEKMPENSELKYPHFELAHDSLDYDRNKIMEQIKTSMKHKENDDGNDSFIDENEWLINQTDNINKDKFIAKFIGNRYSKKDKKNK